MFCLSARRQLREPYGVPSRLPVRACSARPCADKYGAGLLQGRARSDAPLPPMPPTCSAVATVDVRNMFGHNAQFRNAPAAADLLFEALPACYIICGS